MLIPLTGTVLDQIINGEAAPYDVSGQDRSGAKYLGLALPLADFRCCRLVGTNFAGSDLQRAKFVESDLAAAVFPGSKLCSADFSKVKAPQADFSGATAVLATFSYAKLVQAKFQGAKLAGARFDHADLTAADFSGADLTGADFSKAVGLETANFKDATLDGVVMPGRPLKIVRSDDNHRAAIVAPVMR